jgi:hypothetical protein
VPDDKSGLERASSVAKDLIAISRDAILLILLLLLLLAPGTINSTLVKAGFTKGTIAGFEWEAQIRQSTEQTKAVGEAVSRADETYKTLIDRLAELERSASDPGVKRSISGLSVDARASQGELAVADRALKRSLATQQAIVEAVSPASVPAGGWLFLGKVNEGRDAWVDGSPATIAGVAPAIARGSRLTVRDDAYWRADSAAGAHASAPILSVARAGTVVVVDEVDYSHARGGGWFVWVRGRPVA